MNQNRDTRRAMTLVERYGFRVTERTGGRADVYVIDQPGEDGVFGSIEVGPRSGRVLRAHLYNGNSDAFGHHPEDALSLIAALRRVPALNASRG